MTEEELNLKVAEITAEVFDSFLFDEEIEIFVARNLIYTIAGKVAKWAYEQGQKD